MIPCSSSSDLYLCYTISTSVWIKCKLHNPSNINVGRVSRLIDKIWSVDRERKAQSKLDRPEKGRHNEDLMFTHTIMRSACLVWSRSWIDAKLQGSVFEVWKKHSIQAWWCNVIATQGTAAKLHVLYRSILKWLGRWENQEECLMTSWQQTPLALKKALLKSWY